MRQEIFYFHTPFFLKKKKKALYQVKTSGLQLDFAIFRQPSNQHIIETNCLKLYAIDPEIGSILIFQVRVWKQFLQHILFMIFQQNCSLCYILFCVITDQIHCLVAITSRYIGQYVYCNCLLIRLRCHGF